jgi:2',3'-cyclic-nucleotide 2'-phosphodiesterase (5'-nucleotidase family)
VKRTIRLTAFCLLSVLLPSALALAQKVSLTILHTNDTHGHLMPFSYPSVVPSGSELSALKVRKDIGGIARRATLVKRLRQELEGRGTAVWLLDAGDFLDGTPFSTEYHGEADIAAMNAVGYTFGTLGNHEFNIPLATLKKLIGTFRFPILCANAVETATGKPLVPASTIRELGPLKIGIFGLLTRSSSVYPAAKEGVTIAEEIETAQRMVKVLRPEAGIVIALSHAGEQVDQQIAQKVLGVDVIIGGHSHTRLPSGEFVWHSDELKETEVNGTIIAQAHQWGGELGRLDLLFTRDSGGVWHVERYRTRLIPVTPDIPEDQAVAGIVDRYWKPISAHYGEIIGQAAEDFTIRGDDMEPYNLVTDLIREAMGTEINLENTGSIRAPLIKGNITRADLNNMDPFDNTVVLFKISGRQLKEILRKNRPAVSGIRYCFQNGEITEVTVAGQPLDNDRIYTVASNSWLTGTMLKGVEVVDTGKLRRDVVMEQIRKKGTVKPVYDGRRIVIAP